MKQQINIVRSIQEGKKDESYKMSNKEYYLEFEKTLQPAFTFLNGEELLSAFDNAFKILCKEVEAGKISVDGEAVKGLNPSVQGFLMSKGEQYLKSIVQRKEENEEDFEIIRSVQEDGEKAILKAYRDLRAYFFSFAAGNFSSIGEESVADVFQDAMIVVIEYIQKGKFRVVNTDEGRLIIGLRNGATIRTFLVSIGKRMLQKEWKFPETATPPEEFKDVAPSAAASDESGAGQEIVYSTLEKAFSQLGKKCKQILLYKYWFTLSMKEIRDILDYKSPGAVRTQKSRCIDDLKEIFNRLK